MALRAIFAWRAPPAGAARRIHATLHKGAANRVLSLPQPNGCAQTVAWRAPPAGAARRIHATLHKGAANRVLSLPQPNGCAQTVAWRAPPSGEGSASCLTSNSRNRETHRATHPRGAARVPRAGVDDQRRQDVGAQASPSERSTGWAKRTSGDGIRSAPDRQPDRQSFACRLGGLHPVARARLPASRAIPATTRLPRHPSARGCPCPESRRS
jgi:hypothetical protein